MGESSKTEHSENVGPAWRFTDHKDTESHTMKLQVLLTNLTLLVKNKMCQITRNCHGRLHTLSCLKVSLCKTLISVLSLKELASYQYFNSKSLPIPTQRTYVLFIKSERKNVFQFSTQFLL